MPADRTAKVKEARSSAQAEIEAYKASKEAEFKKFEDDVCPLLRLPPPRSC